MPKDYISFMSEGVFYIIKVEDTKIMLDLRNKMKWPKTQSMKIWEQKEEEKKQNIQCPRCQEYITRGDLDEYKCKRHDEPFELIYTDKYFVAPKNAEGLKCLAPVRICKEEDALSMI